MEHIEGHAEERIRDAMDWMARHRRGTYLLTTLDHHDAEFAPHERLPECERSAARHGMHLVYAGAEAKTIEGDEPYWYVLLSDRECLTEAEVRAVIPGFQPVHHWHHGQFHAVV